MVKNSLNGISMEVYSFLKMYEKGMTLQNNEIFYYYSL